MNYCYGNCVLSIEGDENIYIVKPYYEGIELEKNIGYLKDGYVSIYRGDIVKQKKYKSGIFSDKKGNVIFALPESEKYKFEFNNIKDDSIQSIVKQVEKIDPKLRRKIMSQLRRSSDTYIPEFDKNDDFLKHLVKLILHEKKIDLKQYKHKFPKSHGITNIKAALETKTSPDGKKGSLTVNNLIKWLEILDMDIEVTFKDSENSELPCGKIFKYTTEDGYNITTAEGFEYLDEEEENEDGEDYDE